jgi:hypothetical protein
MRTLPYMKAWYDKYHDQGLEIISIHTPEFGFEKVKSNVEQAVKKEALPYAVVLDNNYGTWNAFANQYWPRKYLIDIDGYVVYDHAGEGDYDVTERAIQKALGERAVVLGTSTVATGTVSPKDVVVVDATKSLSLETYFGSSRNEFLGNGEVGLAGRQTLTLPKVTQNDALYLDGAWNFESEYAEASGASNEIQFTYNAKDVYFVASSQNGVRVTITVDGKPAGSFAGDDVDSTGGVLIKENRLYKIIHGSNYGKHTLRMKVEGAGLTAYTFTFG